jgi:hypothetical protein
MVDRRENEDGSLKADGLGGSMPPEDFGVGRVCIEANCQVRLSRYNSTDWCSLHESPLSTQRPFDTTRRGRPRSSTSRRRNSSRARRRQPAA